MKRNRVYTYLLLMVTIAMVGLSSCQKMSTPALGDYPKDADPHFPLYPGGPLKFFVAFDGTTDNPLMNAVDSVRANFASTNTGTEDEGISGKSYKGSESAFAAYSQPNDFTTTSTSFTIAFWIKKTPQAAGKGTNFAFSLNAKGYSWTNTKLFLEFEDAGNPSSTDSAAAKFYINDQWTEYITNVGANKYTRMPKVLDGTWHHLAFTYDGSSSNLKAYIDGALFRTDAVGTLGPVNFGNYTDFTIGGPNQYIHDQNTWMGFFDGQLDQFRMYNTVLSATDITALFTNKQ